VPDAHSWQSKDMNLVPALSELILGTYCLHKWSSNEFRASWFLVV